MLWTLSSAGHVAVEEWWVGVLLSPPPWQLWNGSVSRNSSLESQVKGVLFIRSAQALIRTGGIFKMLVKYFLQNN